MKHNPLRVMVTGMIILALVFGSVIACTGCAVAPNTISPFVEHVSHISQHEPFTSHPTNYGYEEIGVQAHWNLPAHFYVDVAEGYNPGKSNTNGQATDGLYGGREVFTARIGYTFRVKP